MSDYSDTIELSSSPIPYTHYTEDDVVDSKPRIVASVVSCFSMAGALLIILSYLFIKSIRTKAREVLFHLSLGDLGVGLANLIGAIVNYGDLIDKCHAQHHQHSNVSTSSLPLSCYTYVSLCKTQAFFAEFFTLASILWTLLLAFYVYILVLDTSRRLSLWIVRFGYVICWGLPLLISVWFVVTKKLGKTKLGGAGWCSLRVENREGDVQFFTVFFGSDLWVLMTFLLILILYSTTHCHLKEKVNQMKQRYSGDVNFSQNASDTKFLAIPFCFLVLRLGSLVVSILFVYTHAWMLLNHTARKVIFYWMVLGDCSEGLVNGIIFCLLTPRIRQKICTCLMKKQPISFRRPISLPSETLEQRRLLENAEVSVHSNYKYSLNPSVSTSSSSDSEDYN